MPRIPTCIRLQARSIDPLLPILLWTCRDLQSAQNELRWLREHVDKTFRQNANSRSETSGRRSIWKYALVRMCLERGRGRPLQHILGTEFFGDLEIRCNSRVLIPRPETAETTTALLERLKRVKAKDVSTLRVLDLCSGTGCISLLLHRRLTKQTSRKSPALKILGVDISPQAVRLARANRHRLIALSSHKDISFALADVRGFPAQDDTHRANGSSPRAPNLTDLLHSRNQPTWDILISNPPYISPSAFSRTTARSVRNYEPRTALVPSWTISKSPPAGKGGESRGDAFYPPILAHALAVQAKIVLLEVGDMPQALRVAAMAARQSEWDGIEIWRDGVAYGGEGESREEVLQGRTVWVRGSGEGRCIVCWKGVDFG